MRRRKKPIKKEFRQNVKKARRIAVARGRALRVMFADEARFGVQRLCAGPRERTQNGRSSGAQGKVRTGPCQGLGDALSREASLRNCPKSLSRITELSQHKPDGGRSKESQCIAVEIL